VRKRIEKPLFTEEDINDGFIVVNDNLIDCAYLLAVSGEKKATEFLASIVTTQSSNSDNVRVFYSEALYWLATLGDTRALRPVLKEIEKIEIEDYYDCQYNWIFMLGSFQCEDVEKALADTRIRDNDIRLLLTAWVKGGEALEKLQNTTQIGAIWKLAARARWGDIYALERIISLLTGGCCWCEDIHEEALFLTNQLSRFLPDNFPSVMGSNQCLYYDDIEITLIIKKWYKNNKHRLAWDEDKKRYYLREERNREIEK
jgi:hypothetical protein